MEKITLQPIKSLNELRSDKPGYTFWLMACALNLGGTPKSADDAYRWLEINANETGSEQGVVDECNGIREMIEQQANEQVKRLEELHEFHKKSMDKYGFYIHFVPDALDNPSLMNIHTHGVVESFAHPDLQIVIGLPQRVALTLMHTMVDWIKEGNKVEIGKEYDFVLQGMNVLFIEVKEQKRTVLRMILPDKQGKLKETEIAEPYKQQYYAKDLPDDTTTPEAEGNLGNN